VVLVEERLVRALALAVPRRIDLVLVLLVLLGLVLAPLLRHALTEVAVLRVLAAAEQLRVLLAHLTALARGRALGAGFLVVLLPGVELHALAVGVLAVGVHLVAALEALYQLREARPSSSAKRLAVLGGVLLVVVRGRVSASPCREGKSPHGEGYECDLLHMRIPP
jgi:hypothetical protein